MYNMYELGFEELDNILMNNEVEDYVHRWKEICNNFCAHIDSLISEELAEEAALTITRDAKAKEETLLNAQLKEVKLSSDDSKIRQKVLEKKISKMVKQEQKLMTEIEEGMKKKETLSLQLVDLQDDFQEEKKDMKNKWDSLKKACKVYKDLLDIHLKLEIAESQKRVIVTFFINENRKNSPYQVILQSNNDNWSVDTIKPKISPEDTKELKKLVKFTDLTTTTDVPLLLCSIRKIFLNILEKRSKSS